MSAIQNDGGGVIMTKKIKESDLARAGMAKCPVPVCGKPFKLEEDQKGTPPKRAPVCPACTYFLGQLLFWFPRIRVAKAPPTTPSGIALPGSPEFEAKLGGVHGKQP
jgi:hypothetical protein